MSAGNFVAKVAPEWTGHLTQNVALGVLDDTAESNLYEPPLRYLRTTGTGNVTVTLYADDTADATKNVLIPVVAGQELGVFAIRKIWATGTTVPVASLVGHR